MGNYHELVKITDELHYKYEYHRELYAPLLIKRAIDERHKGMNMMTLSRKLSEASYNIFQGGRTVYQVSHKLEKTNPQMSRELVAVDYKKAEESLIAKTDELLEKGIQHYQNTHDIYCDILNARKTVQQFFENRMPACRL